jgi:hypothetical protein
LDGESSILGDRALPMTRTFCVTVETATESACAEGEFTEQDLAVLERYLAQVEQLVAIRSVREGLPCDLSMSFDIQKLGGSFTAQLPDDDTLATVLHRLRPLILQREAASFVNACAVLGRHVKERSVRTILREKRDLFENSDRAQTWTVSANNVRINAENVLQDWLNGVEYHTDEERRARIEELMRGPEILVRHSLVSMLLNKIDAIRAIATLISVLLNLEPAVRFARNPSDQETVVTIRRCPAGA